MKYDKDKWLDRLAARSDISGSLTHLTRQGYIDGKKVSSIQILIKILKEGKIDGSTTSSGFICGDTPAVCFQDAPIYSICQNIYTEQEFRKISSTRTRYVGVGLLLPKPYVYSRGGRPVVYDDTDVAKKYLERDHWWRIVRFDLSNTDSYIDWTHEREWRVPNEINFRLKAATVIVPTERAYKEFISKCEEIDRLDIVKEIKGIITLNKVFF